MSKSTNAEYNLDCVSDDMVADGHMRWHFQNVRTLDDAWGDTAGEAVSKLLAYEKANANG